MERKEIALRQQFVERDETDAQPFRLGLREGVIGEQSHPEARGSASDRLTDPKAGWVSA